MATIRRTDVTIDSSLGEVIGATIELQVGAVPTATVNLRSSSEGFKIYGGGSFPDINARRRAQEENVDISVRVRTGGGDSATRNFKFVGLLDGYSISNVVGNNSYTAILKNKAQSLLEITTVMPGLVPISTNIFKIPSHAITTSSQGEEKDTIRLWTAFTRENPQILKLPPIRFYVELLKLIVKKQQSGWEKSLGVDKLISEKTPLKEIFDSPQYKKNLKYAYDVLDSISYEACSGFVNDLLMSSTTSINTYNIFTQGPTILLENLLNFLATLGCSLIISNNKAFIVPINSVIKQENYYPGKGQLSTTVNQAGPADYNSYVFNDMGFRDINSVILMTPKYSGGTYFGGPGFDRAIAASYAAPEGEAKGSGVYVTRAHAWSTLSAVSPKGTDSREGKNNLDGKGSVYSKQKTFKDIADEVKKEYAERAKTNIDEIKDQYKGRLDNYAETKYYQARFTDRQGSITLDFNPAWCPGVGGELFIRESEMHLHFYVTSVMHRVETGPPATGSAITIINFNCGRFGANPVGSTSDEFLGYDADIEKSIRDAFVNDFK